MSTRSRGLKAQRGRRPESDRPRPSATARGALRSQGNDEPSDELTLVQMRELRRRLVDMDDPTRFLLVSRIAPRFDLYYQVSDDVYVMNDPTGATLFKRRVAALALKRILGPGVQLLRCSSRMKGGRRVPILPRSQPAHDKSTRGA